MTQAIPDLEARSGLTDEIAFLRAAYPQAAWSGHRNFGQLTSFWLSVHQALRREGAELQALILDYRLGAHDPADFQRSFVPSINQFLGHLDAHHRIEDHVYFPRFRALDERMVDGFDLLERDHVLIHQALEQMVASARQFLGALGSGASEVSGFAEEHAKQADRLVALLDRHLADEEDLVIPALLHHGERALNIPG